MAKKTRTELSTLAINTNLPDNTTELITPTTERAQLTDERESVVNYKDDLGGVPNAGKFLTVAVDGESLTMVDEPSGVPAWVTFVTATINQMVLKSGGDGTGTSKVFLKFTSYDGTLNTFITHNGVDGGFAINGHYSSMSLGLQINFNQGGTRRIRVETNGDLTHWGNVLRLNAEQVFDANPLYTLKFQGRITGPSGGSYTDEEFANIKGGKENATENDKAGYLSFTTGIADGTLTERLRISSGGLVTVQNGIKFGTGDTLDAYEEGTYTPTLTPVTSGTINLNTAANTLSYTKIGRIVTVTGYCSVLSVVSSPTGSMKLSLPFTPSTGDAYLSSPQINFNEVVSSAVNDFWAQVASGFMYIYIGTSTGVLATSAQQMQANTDFRVSITYFI